MSPLQVDATTTGGAGAGIESRPAQVSASDATLTVGRDASLTLGTDSLIVLDNSIPTRRPRDCCGFLPLSKSLATTSIPFHNVLWAELSDYDLTIHYARAILSTAVRPAYINYPLEKSDGSKAKAWIERLLQRAYGLAQRAKRIKVLINPFGGKGSAKKYYTRDIEPVFAAARCHIDVEYTKYQGHAREIAAQLDVAAYDVIACCSGDGIPHEVFNGLGEQANARYALKKLAVAQMPCGTGNAASINLNGTASPSLAALAVVKGLRTPLDLVSVTQGSRRTLSFLSQAVGIVAETDLGTEHMRWMGSFRFTLGFLVRLMGKTVYPCDIAVSAVDGDKTAIKQAYREHRAHVDEAQIRSNQDQHQYPPCSSSTSSSTTTTMSGGDDSGSEREGGGGERGAAAAAAAAAGEGGEGAARDDDDDDGKGLPALKYGSVQEALPRGWQLAPYPNLGNFYAGNMAYMSDEANFFQAAQPSDGALDLICVDGDISRLAAIRCLLAAGDGSFFDMPHVWYRKVDAFRIVPRGWQQRRDLVGRRGEGYISIDGEKVPFEPFQVEVHPGLATVLSKSGWNYETPLL